MTKWSLCFSSPQLVRGAGGSDLVVVGCPWCQVKSPPPRAVTVKMSSKPSGSEFKKRREARAKNEAEVLKKVPKISAFFGSDDKSKCDPVTEKPDNSDRDVPLTVDPGPSTRISGDNESDSVKSVGDSAEKLESDIESGENLIGAVFLSDPALWKIDENLRDYVAAHGVSQNCGVDFSASKRLYPDQARYASKSMFTRTLLNGETQNRSWMVYSKSKGCVYCVPCMLFGSPANSDSVFVTGYNDWKNATQRLKDHENSRGHKTCLGNLKVRANTKGRADSHLLEQTEKEVSYWRALLRRVVAAVKFLAIYGLAFRGSSEKIGEESNSKGNYLGLLEFLSEFDPFLKKHIDRYGTVGSGHTSYLSSTVSEEFILLMAQKVKTIILQEAKDSKYFGIVLDSTPDISHTDELTFILRYVKNGEPVERFLCFLPNIGHKAEEVVEAVIKVFEECGLDVSNCRGQSYDNASNMSGIYSGVQARIKELCSHAEYVPCAAHSLNLVGSSAVESCVMAISFFSLLQELYNFFSCSTKRWEVLCKNCTRVLHSLSKTRWAARHDACLTLVKDWTGVIKSLDEIASDEHQPGDTRHEARCLKDKLDSLETALMVTIWGSILETFNKVSKKLQSQAIDLGEVKRQYKALSDYVSNLREDFDRLETLAKEKSSVTTYKYDKLRRPKRKLTFGESREGEVSFSGREDFRVNTFNVILDTLSVELRKRADKYDDLHSTFGFFEDIDLQQDSAIISNKAAELVALYPNDLEPTLVDESLHLKAFLIQCGSSLWEKKGDKLIKKTTSLRGLYKFLYDSDVLEIYPNVDIALRMILATPVTNCSAERSFSTLRRVKNYLRSTMGMARLTGLALLTIEQRITGQIDYEDVIDDFANKKARKKPL
ncbi:zinc finger MYM-type protein 1-like [Bemisia tabaci]|uniref:zinc finger MYM-type protein 1-like n=1 Tax=Bemisia tabaci TaxID=7038 RepID=UPI003B28B5FF